MKSDVDWQYNKDIAQSNSRVSAQEGSIEHKKKVFMTDQCPTKQIITPKLNRGEYHKKTKQKNIIYMRERENK